MRRTELLGWLQREFSTVTDALDVETLDLPDGYRPVIDATWRAFGAATGAAEIVTTEQHVDGVYAVATYLALKRFQRKAVPQVNVGLGGGLALTKARAQLFDHLGALIKDQTEVLRRMGLLDIVLAADTDASVGAAWLPAAWIAHGGGLPGGDGGDEWA